MRKSGVLFAVGLMSMLMLSGCGTPSVGSQSNGMNVGDHVTMGNYQGLPIEWRVLDIEDGQALLLSEYALDTAPYNEGDLVDTNWEQCSLREWLNEEFYETAFSEEEQEKIILTTLQNAAYQGPGCTDEPVQVISYTGTVTQEQEQPDTEDYVFLLSGHQVEVYMPTDVEEDEVYTITITSQDAICKFQEERAQEVSIDENDTCEWWLRSVFDVHHACCVTERGGINTNAYMNEEYAVRPAMWISLDE